jgi:putative addiction module killer protein/probable addiction module antidote protein
LFVVEIRQTSEFKEWLLSLRDAKAKARIAARIARAENGNLGDSKPVGEGVSEMRIDYGPGYRVYYRQRGNVLVVLLCGGDKSTQLSDIRRAHELAKREG